MSDIKPKEHVIEPENLDAIKNPAYMIDKEGCIIAWNKEFEKLTNFIPKDIDHSRCFTMINAVQQLDDNHYVKICSAECKYRSPTITPINPFVIEKVWINCKDSKSRDTKHLVDIYVFPFQKSEEQIHEEKAQGSQTPAFALHVIHDREQTHDRVHFYKDIVSRNGGLKVPGPNIQIKEIVKGPIEVEGKKKIQKVLVKGTSSIPEGSHIWVLVRRIGDKGWLPQRPIRYKREEWEVHITLESKVAEEKFEIAVIAVDEPENQQINEKFKEIIERRGQKPMSMPLHTWKTSREVVI